MLSPVMANKSDRMNPMFKGEDRAASLDRRDQLVHQGAAKARAESEAKTVRLRALRLEKEAADMDDIPWYSEASLLAPGRVFCAGSLAQCVRRWSRLPEIDQMSAHIKLTRQFKGRMKLSREDVAVLASSHELLKV